MLKKIDPFFQRRGQIEREIEKLTDPKNQRSQRHFKLPDSFDKWFRANQIKLDELREELEMLEFPEGFNECPLAVAAEELGLSLSEMQWIASEGLVGISSAGYYAAGSRITREELGRAIDVGPEELMRRAEMQIPEIFAESLTAIADGNVSEIRKAFDRIERRDSCINPFALACEMAIHFLENNITELQESVKFILKRESGDLLAVLDAVRSVMIALPKRSHILEVVREQVLAIADGKVVNPFRRSFSPNKATQFNSQLSENENLAILICDVVMDSVERYKFLKSMQGSKPFTEAREEELRMLVQNAAYTALEARRTYDDSPSSKMFVDRFVGLRPTRRKPPELLVLLPKTT